MLLSQIFAVVIFFLMFLLIVLDKIERHVVTLSCAALTLVLVFGLTMRSPITIWNTLNLSAFFTPGFWYQASESGGSSGGINWQTILFVAGMMIMVEGMGRSGFFDWLCMKIARLVKYRTVPLFLAFMAMSSVLAMFIDSITVILFLAAVTIRLGHMLKFNPVPMILSEIFCANLGGSATMCGDPPNIILGTSLGYTFMDFVVNTGLIALVSLLLVMVYFFFCFRKELLAGETEIDIASLPRPEEFIKDKKRFAISCAIFLTAVVLLVTHAQTGLTVSLIGTLIACVTLLTAGKERVALLKAIDYKTLLFFVGLFVVVGGLEQTGVLVVIAGLIGKISGGNFALMVAIILIGSAFASALVDNIPFAATMIPVIQSLASTQGVALPTLAWAMAIGTDIGGSATPIGASANVVGTSMAAREGYLITWGKYCKIMVPATVLVVLSSLICIYVRYL